ncbi:MAG: hypothetical protein ACKVOQ_22950 [Cyclobacteriaceae bacterium]
MERSGKGAAHRDIYISVRCTSTYTVDSILQMFGGSAAFLGK